MKKIIFLTTLSFVTLTALFGQNQRQIQYRSKYPDIPIVDVHVHTRRMSDVVNYPKVSDVIKQKYGSNLAFWVGLAMPDEPMSVVKAACNNRMIFAADEMRPHKGLSATPEAIVARIREGGFIGLKFWFGDPNRVLQTDEEGIRQIDDPRLENLFATLERENVLMTSLHIADPNGPFDNRQRWMFDPVYYWSQIRAFENVVAKYPNLTIIAAHAAWIICQDAQIDYLRYMFSKYPNFYVDISATCQYMPLVNRDNLRNLYIEYQDRLLFATDGGNVPDDAIERIADNYAHFFGILETDQVVNGGYFGSRPTKGLDLPREVLEKVYYKNALKLYPGLREMMGIK